ncbi:PAS domain-containing protein [Altererythrobacter soli]|uniref:histidine kinase n=1 Tax=Croceibacterium soli TaxID=1739690 RepID=A0A6I4UQ44_9SPHN|nr:PAS domain-containing protein [Croceibacterium soli]MXP41100.1 PAS domain-containing protein [Croceibacterium soli]
MKNSALPSDSFHRALEACIPVQQLEADLVAARNALHESDARFNTLADALPHMVWSAMPDGDHDYFNERWYEFTGVARGTTDSEGWNAVLHPGDRERALNAWHQCLQTGEPYQVEYRLRHRSGEYRWALARAMPMRNSEGEIVRWIGTCTDIHEAKQQAEQLEILSRELSHRIKNIFAVIGSLISLSARHASEHKGYAQQIKQRIAALGRAHEFVRPHSEESRQEGVSATLHALIGQILSPYPARDAGRIEISGEDVPVDDRSATPLALLVHELATNATKYGALGEDGGTVSIRSELQGEDLLLEWLEEDGPAVAGEPQRSGFGTVLSELSIRDQLGGELERDWHESGLRVRIRVPRANLQRQMG